MTEPDGPIDPTSFAVRTAMRDGRRHRPDDGVVDGRRRLALPKGTLIPVVWSRDLPSEPSSCRVYQDSLGDWYVSFVVMRVASCGNASPGWRMPIAAE